MLESTLVLPLRWLGQAGFALGDDENRLLVDVFRSEHELRLYPPPQDNAFLRTARWLLATHEHADHLDLPYLGRLIEDDNPITVVVPADLRSMVLDAYPGATVVGLAVGQSMNCGGAVVHAVSARHASVIEDGYEDSTPERSRWVGYVIEYNGVTVYHAGDTLASEQIVDDLSQFNIDIALLPINGRDEMRESNGIVGNMTGTEAAQLANRIRVRTIVPMHHDAIRGNTCLSGTVAEAVAEQGWDITVVNPARDVDYAFTIEPRQRPRPSGTALEDSSCGASTADIA